jgi:predicted lipoprotein with Yx(FWY)xxD motif
MRNRWSAKLFAVPVLAAGAVAIAACGSSTPPASSSTHSAAASPASGGSASSVTIMTRSTSKGTVLTNAQGKTLYWFAIDTSTTSKCTGSCATYWPPVLGKPVAAAGTSLTMGFGTITRSNGQLQATYDGHPLYTYVSDAAPGQIGGNGLNASGGLWWAMTPTGAKLGSATTSSSGSGGGGGGGYGY